MIALNELCEAAQKAFPDGALRPARAESWRLIAEMGWLMVDLPEADGGLALGAAAEATLCFQLGRVLAGAPLMPALLGLRALAYANFAGRPEHIEGVLGGAYVPLNLLPGSVTRGQDGTLSGRISGVLEADMAGHIVAGLADEYLLIPLDAAGVLLDERPLWDESRRLFDVVLAGYRPDPALRLAQGEAARALHDRLAVAAHIAFAADALGGARAVLTMSVDHLNTRRQFDRPLAMFQALKHRAADLAAAIAAAEALLWARAADPATTPAQSGALKALACATYARVTEEAVQFHGGIGLTEEHDCHLFVKRAQLDLWLAGGVDALNGAAGRALLAD